MSSNKPCWKCGEENATVKMTDRQTGKSVYIHKQLPRGGGCDLFFDPLRNVKNDEK